MVCLNWQCEESTERQEGEGKAEVMTGKSRDEAGNKGERGEGEKEVRKTRNGWNTWREGGSEMREVRGAEQRGGIGMCEGKCEEKEKAKSGDESEMRLEKWVWRTRRGNKERRGRSLNVSSVVRTRPLPRKQLKRSWQWEYCSSFVFHPVCCFLFRLYKIIPPPVSPSVKVCAQTS